MTRQKVDVIPASVRSVQNGGQLKSQTNIRVAAYCRVSTGDESQQTSYTTQKAFYKDLITRKPGWIFAGIYADEAKSGTNREHREEFNRMIKDAMNVEYVELLLNSVDRCIAIRPCEKDNPNAIRWGRLKEGRWCASTLGCRGLAKALFDMMEWEEGLKYRFRGQLVGQNDDKLMLFELDEPEMVKEEEIVLPSKEQDEEGKTVKQTIYIFPPEWAGTFGKPITSIAQVGILQQEHYSGNWDVLRPATEIEEMNTFTADGLNALLHEAEKIMEGWTDTDE